MSWLNWSLKLYIRLRTISILIPIHITHVYVQWMLYSFVWLYLIKCVSHTQFLLIKHKKIFECFNYFWKVYCFWKVFFFCKNIKNFKNSVALFWRFDRGSIQSHAPSLHRSFLRLTGRSTSRSQKRVRKFFQNFGFLNFSQLGLATCLRVEAPVARLYKIFRGSLRDFLAGVPSSHEKHLENFSKILSLRCLVAWLGDLFATWFSREKCVFCRSEERRVGKEC